MRKPPPPVSASPDQPDDDWMASLQDAFADAKPFAEDSLHDVVSWRKFVKRDHPNLPPLVTRAVIDAMTPAEKSSTPT